eukprot:GDKH01007112.1.p2 GENE.GDKH01007112.1~~GDKH01007112.1.p2  ORF type:complete len:53 (-),score=14.94 GDKH01007112.1:70-228(-)
MMQMPMMGKPPPKEYLSAKWKLVLRTTGFAAAIAAFIYYGDSFEFPENPKYA